ncbi:hypothetical protein [Kordiimonas marina]|uniref:hypothetical protein n=1 Tax=Kordiimonas marina TaxID=2872312 RepID=UPI001FF29AAE|nr:hypothetical protein [Kordiimonas marina]MCJ9427500.1 hypothetical protein [Kordiimonas marina]
MANAAQMVEQINPFTFMGLMASKGNIPGVVSKSDDKQFMLVALEEGARGLVSDLTAKGDFFSLMTEFGMMKAEDPKKPYMFRIVRPSGLGGGFKGGNFGGGAFAH